MSLSQLPPPITAVHNIANFAVDLVVSLGSDTVFSLTGGMAMHLNRAVAAQIGLTKVFCQHEQAVIAAAEGYAKAANFRKAGFAVVTAGPGVSNCVTSLISANGDSTPMIVLAGQIKTVDIDTFGTRTHGIQEIKSKELITPCVKLFVRLTEENFIETLIDGIAQAFLGRPGVIFIEIPLDVQGRLFEYEPSDIATAAAEVRKRSAVLDASLNSERELTAALESLLAADRPLLYIGNGSRAANTEESALAFARRYGIPCAFSWLSEDMMPASDPLFTGCPGGFAEMSANDILSHADTIVFLGARLDLGTTAFQRHAFGQQAHRIVVDVDSAELAKFGALPKTDLVPADLRALPCAIAAIERSTSSAETGWLTWCQTRRRDYLAEEKSRMASDKMNVYNLTAIFNTWTDDKIWLPASSGYAEETFSRFLAPQKNTRFFNGAALGSMGLGLPHSIGASFGSNRRVCCLEADGGIMLNLQELATLVHYAPRGFVIFLLNNNGYESIRASQTRFFGGVSGVDEVSGVYIPEYSRICAAFGLKYLSINTPAELAALLPTLGRNDPPVLVDMHIDQFEYRGPAVKTVMDKNGKPSSTPLSEITW
ncbi:MAG: thiamine pyrophosphate-binding protein [Acidobacteriota bacterium]|nr:thiamine pyrophosphate-binding protein [Acidobacteriota bacterium]